MKLISVHNEIFIFDISKMFKIMNIHFKFKTSDISELTLCILMNSSFWFDTIRLGSSIVYIYGVSGYML